MSDREDAEVLSKIDGVIWTKLRLRSGSDAERRWSSFVAEVADRTPYFVRHGVAELLEDENHHSFLRALKELGRLDHVRG